MSGILSGLFHAPLTAIFLIVEITGGYELMVPLMIVSSVSYAVSKQFEKHSLDVKTLAEKGEVYTSDKDKNILQSINIHNLVSKNFKTLTLDNPVEEIVVIFSKTDQKIIPILDKENNLIGIVDFKNVKSMIFNPFNVKFSSMSEVITKPEATIILEDKVEKIMDLFEELQVCYLPVTQKGKYFGILSKVDLLERYRVRLKEMIID